MQQAVSPCGVSLEYVHALQDAQAWEAEYGNPITIHVRSESGVTRDDYNSIVARQSDLLKIEINAATIDYQPSKYKLEKAGLREECDVMVHVAMQYFMDAGLAFDDLEPKRMTFVIGAIPGESNGARYEVADKCRAVPFGNGFLYIAFGLKRG